ncbi:MAG: homoprotocatechuate degradation operon regulator HpaR [Actinomycetota bacterium]
MTSAPMRPFDASLPMALLQARESAMRLFRPLLAEHDLTEQQWRVLRALTATDMPVDAGELAARTFLLAPSLSRILANLEDRDLIVRAVDPDDQRRSLIALSAAGAAQVRAIAPESEQRYTAIETAFGADRLARLLDELHDLATLDLEATPQEASR